MFRGNDSFFSYSEDTDKLRHSGHRRPPRGLVHRCSVDTGAGAGRATARGGGVPVPATGHDEEMILRTTTSDKVSVKHTEGISSVLNVPAPTAGSDGCAARLWALGRQCDAPFRTACGQADDYRTQCNTCFTARGLASLSGGSYVLT